MKESQKLVGRRFGKGIVIKKVPRPEHLKRKGFYWLVKCDCGGTSIVDTTTLKKKWKSCRCEENLIGEKFYNGTIVSLEEKKDGYRIWKLICDCGNSYIARTESLKSGNTKSCGCRNKRQGKNHPRYKGFNDLSKDYWTKIQRGAKARNIEFNITMKQAWNKYLRQNKKCALTGWDISLERKNQKQTASLDRIDSKKGYTLKNIQWVHKDVNKIKQNYSEEYLIQICEAIVSRGLSLD